MIAFGTIRCANRENSNIYSTQIDLNKIKINDYSISRQFYIDSESNTLEFHLNVIELFKRSHININMNT